MLGVGLYSVGDRNTSESAKRMKAMNDILTTRVRISPSETCLGYPTDDACYGLYIIFGIVLSTSRGVDEIKQAAACIPLNPVNQYASTEG